MGRPGGKRERERVHKLERESKERGRVGKGVPRYPDPVGSLSELLGYNICKPRVTNMEKKKKKKKKKKNKGRGVPRSGCTLIPIRVYPVGPVVGEVSRDFNKLFRKS